MCKLFIVLTPKAPNVDDLKRGVPAHLSYCLAANSQWFHITWGIYSIQVLALTQIYTETFILGFAPNPSRMAIQ